jgi:3-dehydroquinate dehydratase-2
MSDAVLPVPAPRVLVVHGPNLNLLGQREPGVYGSGTLQQIDTRLTALGGESGVDIVSFQSNHEGAIVERIQAAAGDGTRFIVINPAAFTHTSVAIRDALAAVAIPFIEVHLSNVFARETFRHRSLLSDLATGVICGLGTDGYLLAVRAAAARLAAEPR